MRPPSIIHLHGKTSDNREELCVKCSSSLHFSKAEKLLLLFYAAHSNGFAPSAQYIAAQTKISRRNIFYVRDRLINHGVVAVERNGVYIDWERIRLFSTLDPKQTKGVCTISPVRSDAVRSQDFIGRIIMGDEGEACRMLEALSEEEYKKIQLLIKKEIRKK